MGVQRNGALTGAWSIAAHQRFGLDRDRRDPDLVDERAKSLSFDFPTGRIKASCKPMVRKGASMSYTAFAVCRALIALSAVVILIMAWRNGGKA